MPPDVTGVFLGSARIMGCCSSQPEPKDGAADKYRVDGAHKKDPKNFNFKRNISEEWDIFHRETLGRGAFGEN
eukprot:scaffold473164_cov46-Prasinocladus_malaysianus.AAC.1